MILFNFSFYYNNTIMSNSNVTQTLVKSMNGILSFNTGGGVVISGDTIEVVNLELTNLTAPKHLD